MILRYHDTVISRYHDKTFNVTFARRSQYDLTEGSEAFVRPLDNCLYYGFKIPMSRNDLRRNRQRLTDPTLGGDEVYDTEKLEETFVRPLDDRIYYGFSLPLAPSDTSIDAAGAMCEEGGLAAEGTEVNPVIAEDHGGKSCEYGGLRR